MAPTEEQIAQALDAYERGVPIKRITADTTVSPSKLYEELAAHGRQPQRVQRTRLINRDTTEMVKEAWARLEVLGSELARLTQDAATMAARLTDVLAENEELRRKIQTYELTREEPTTAKRGRKAN